jgi:glucose/arabinose dehydrogenase
MAQPNANKPPPNHGMVLAACMEVAPGKLMDTTRRSDTTNYVYRGRVISLNKERSVSLCFDTDLMRVAGAWIGTPVAYTADKNMGPSVEGKMLFGTKPGPGCTKEKKWDDPREGGEGPLPQAWAHYRGIYCSGDRVVLSYTIGDCEVLETPTCAVGEDLVAVIRTFDFGASSRMENLALFDQDSSKQMRAYPLFPGTRQAAHITEIDRGDNLLVLAVTGKVGGNFGTPRFSLAVPAHRGHLRERAIIAQIPKGKNVAALLTPLLQTNIEEVESLTKGAPPRWKQVIDTKGTIAHASKFTYVVDDIGLPVDNPWHTPIRPGGLDFFPDGRAALCTWDGDVWIVSGLDGKLDKVRWKRFASGLQQPLGLKIIDGFIYTAGRDQITKLHDLNGGGEADFYENFNNDAALTLQRHEFVMDLQTDAKGNLYFGRSGHYVASKRGDNCCIYKLSPDGKKLEVFARGFREPNGLSIGPDGTMIAGDNEGNGVPQTPLYRLKAGGFYGYRPSKSEELATKGATWEYAEKPIVWLPTSVDRSAGSQVWVPDNRFGPLQGQLLHTSYGNCALYSVLIDRKAEPWQGAVWKWPLAFTSGVMRARFNPKDGQLYLCGLRGWSTNAVKDGQFCRVRYTGKALPMPVGFEVTPAGLRVAFSAALDRAAAEDDDNWSGEWSNAFGKEGAPSKMKHELPISKVALSPDGKTVTVGLEKVQPAANFTLQYRLKADAGAPVVGDLHGTIHRVP